MKFNIVCTEWSPEEQKIVLNLVNTLQELKLSTLHYGVLNFRVLDAIEEFEKNGIPFHGSHANPHNSVALPLKGGGYCVFCNGLKALNI
jgi:hypothetical protein